MQPVKELLVKYGITPKGVLHVGAHNGAEYIEYKAMGFSRITMFEPQPRWAEHIHATYGADPTLSVVNKAVGSSVGTMDLYVETHNAGMSCSLLRPLVHLEQYPDITFDSTMPVPVTTLDAELPSHGGASAYNVMNMDIQGYELEALKGAVSVLPHLDAIYTEVNQAELYEGCGQIGEIDMFLKSFGFSRVETDWMGGTWGDALYVRSLV